MVRSYFQNPHTRFEGVMSDSKLDVIILHYALRHRKFMLELVKSIQPDYFVPAAHNFYNILEKNFKDPFVNEILSLPALIDYAQKHNFQDEVERFKNIYSKASSFKITGEPPADSDFKYYFKQLKERRNQSLIKLLVSNIQDKTSANLGIDELNQTIRDSIREISKLNSVTIYDEGTVGQDVDNVYKEYEAIEENPFGYSGVLVQCRPYDNLSGGLHPGELTLIGGMEGSGKSTLMMNWAIGAWLGSNNVDTVDIVDDGHDVLYFSLEMPRSNKGQPTQGSYLNKRIVASVGEILLTPLKKGELEPQDKARLKKTADFIKRYDEVKKFHVVDIPRDATMSDVESKYLEYKDNGINIDVIVVDYLGIMSVEGGDDSDHLRQGEVAAKMHEFARTYHIPVLSAVQLNRPTGTSNSLNNQKYNSNRISRSSMISHNANNILMIETRDDEHEKTDMIVHITKFRDGEKQTLYLTKAFNKMRVYDTDPRVLTEDTSIIEAEFV